MLDLFGCDRLDALELCHHDLEGFVVGRVIASVLGESIDEGVLELRGDIDLRAAQFDAALDDIVGQTRSTVEGERCLRVAMDLLESIKRDLWLSLVDPVRGTDRRGKGRQIQLFAEVQRLLRVREVGVLLIDGQVVLHAGDFSQLCFYAHTGRHGHLHDLERYSQVLFERQRRCVDHHRSPAGLDAFLDYLHILAVIDVQDDRDG